jgi:hypothetical protein
MLTEISRRRLLMSMQRQASWAEYGVAHSARLRVGFAQLSPAVRTLLK